MTKKLIVMIMVVFIVGCGSNKTTDVTKKVSKEKDYIEQGMEYLRKSDIVNAIQSFDQAIKQDPTNPDNYLVLGQVYMKLQNYTRAVDTLRAATHISPEYGEAYYLLALANQLDGNKDEAVKAAQRSTEIFIKSKDSEKLKRSLLFLKTISQPEAENLPEMVPEAQPAG